MEILGADHLLQWSANFPFTKYVCATLFGVLPKLWTQMKS